MVWVLSIATIVLLIALMIANGRLAERRERAAYLASLSPYDQERLKGFEAVGESWRLFRDIEQEQAETAR